MRKLVYLLKVYLVTIAFSPTLYFVLDGNFNLSFDSKSLIGFLELILIAIVMGGVLSFPTFIILGYYIASFSGKKNVLTNKLILFFIGFIGTFATFAIIDSHSFTSISPALYFPLTYALVLVLSLIIFYPKLNEIG